jgi:hypothetical protein
MRSKPTRVLTDTGNSSLTPRRVASTMRCASRMSRISADPAPWLVVTCRSGQPMLMSTPSKQPSARTTPAAASNSASSLPNSCATHRRSPAHRCSMGSSAGRRSARASPAADTNSDHITSALPHSAITRRYAGSVTPIMGACAKIGRGNRAQKFIVAFDPWSTLNPQSLISMASVGHCAQLLRDSSLSSAARRLLKRLAEARQLHARLDAVDELGENEVAHLLAVLELARARHVGAKRRDAVLDDDGDAVLGDGRRERGGLDQLDDNDDARGRR